MEARSSNRRRKGKQGTDLARLAAFTFHFEYPLQTKAVLVFVGVIVTAE